MFGGVECTLHKSQDFVIMYSISQIECMKEFSQTIIPQRQLFVVQYPSLITSSQVCSHCLSGLIGCCMTSCTSVREAVSTTRLDGRRC